MSLSIGSYNLLNPQFAIKWKETSGLTKDGESNWNDRAPIIAKNLGSTSIVCLQEVSLSMLEDLGKHLGKNIGLAIYASNEGNVESGNAILYDSSIVSLKETRVFSYQSESKNTSTRCAVSSIFQFEDQNNAYTAEVISVHLKGYNLLESNPEKKAKAQKEGLEELYYYLE